MQAAVAFAQGVRALQHAYRFSPEVARRILHWRAAAASGSGSGGQWAVRQASSTWLQQSKRAQQSFSSSSREVTTANAEEAAASQPVLPLCERPAQHAVPLSDLLAWRDAAQQQAEAVGDSWLASDPDGPTAEDLQVRAAPAWEPVGHSVPGGSGDCHDHQLCLHLHKLPVERLAATECPPPSLHPTPVLCTD